MSGYIHANRYLRSGLFDHVPSGLYFDPREQEEFVTPEVLDAPAPHDGAFFVGVHHLRNETGLPPIPGQPPTKVHVQKFKPPTARQPTHLPVLRVSAKVSVKTLLAETVLTQIFENRSQAVIKKAKYAFPLLPGSVIRSFRCKIGKKKELVTRIESKEEARTQFDRAIEESKAAAILEEHTVEIFEVNLGNIPPDETVTVQLVYVGELTVDSAVEQTSQPSEVVLTLPTSIAPRFGQSPDGWSGDGIGSSVDAGGLSILVDISMPFPILGQNCQSHRGASLRIGSLSQSGGLANLKPGEYDPTKAHVELKGHEASLGCDFVHRVSLAQPISQSVAIVEPHPSLEDHCAMMVSISPRDFLSQIEMTYDFTGEIIFVVDCSGSMRSKVEDLRRALEVCVCGLPENSFFNVCLFGTWQHFLWDESQPFNEQTKEAACSAVKNLKADMGGTDLFAALDIATQRSKKNSETCIFVITDGEFWNFDLIVNLVNDAHKNHGIHFFCLGIGNEVSHALVDGIAANGGGLSEVVLTDAGADWKSRVTCLLAQCMNPTSWELTVEVGGDLGAEHKSIDGNNYYYDHGLKLLNVELPSTIQAPFRIPNGHTLSRTSVYLLLSKGAQQAYRDRVTIKARLPTGEQAQITLIPEILDKIPQAIHPLAIKKAVTDLENKTAWPFSEQLKPLREGKPSEFHDAIKQEAVCFGKAWLIASKWTSFVAVDDETKQRQTTRILQQLFQPDQAGNSDLTRARYSVMNHGFPTRTPHEKRVQFTGTGHTHAGNDTASRRKRCIGSLGGNAFRTDFSHFGETLQISPLSSGETSPTSRLWDDNSAGLDATEALIAARNKSAAAQASTSSNEAHATGDSPQSSEGGHSNRGPASPSGPAGHSITKGRWSDRKYAMSGHFSSIDVGATQPAIPEQRPLDHTSYPEIENNFSPPSRRKSHFVESTGNLSISSAGDRSNSSVRRPSTNAILQPNTKPYDLCITTKFPSVRPLPPNYTPPSKQESYGPHNRTEEGVVNEQLDKLLKQTDGEAVGLEEDTPSRSHKPAFLPPPPEELTLDDLVESISISGYWQMTVEKVTLLERFFSADKMQQMEEEVAGVKLERSDVARIVQTALVLVYLEKRFGEQQQLLDLLMKKARRWLYRSLPDDVKRDKIQGLASAAWQEHARY
ncbi:von Willebrand factor type A domain-containing protein [Phyllosticta citribraziliensis]|uniref:von Willebrand factor type A domain-containing protein n=1 Tax=Phyllosticta citribraziliensis TaxID=989973 RepID=A0ABR1LKD6_9PEZI